MHMSNGPGAGAQANSSDPRRLPVAPFLEILARRRRLIIVMTMGAAVVAAVFSLIAPVTYESKLTILPPESSSPLNFGRGSLQSSLASLQIGFATTNNSALYADMLRSRSVRRYAIDKLGLIEAYGIDPGDSLKAYTFALDQLEGDME
ncbi:MAG: Wzz/FepE/Etk N-terminal domain-containing protein, partial [Candidatus Eisenbacteria bacterium]